MVVKTDLNDERKISSCTHWLLKNDKTVCGAFVHGERTARNRMRMRLGYTFDVRGSKVQVVKRLGWPVQIQPLCARSRSPKMPRIRLLD